VVKMAKVNISIPDSFLKEIDKYKEYKKVNRSQFIIDAARVYFDVIEDEKALERRRDAIKRLKKTSEKIMKLGIKDWDTTAEVRKMRDLREKEMKKRLGI